MSSSGWIDVNASYLGRHIGKTVRIWLCPVEATAIGWIATSSDGPSVTVIQNDQIELELGVWHEITALAIDSKTIHLVRSVVLKDGELATALWNDLVTLKHQRRYSAIWEPAPDMITGNDG